MVTLSSLLILHLCALCQFSPNLPVLPSSESMSVVHISPQTEGAAGEEGRGESQQKLKDWERGRKRKQMEEHQLQGGRGSFLVKTRVIHIQGLRHNKELQN